MHRSMGIAAAVVAALLAVAPACEAAEAAHGRKLHQTINYASGTKFGPQLENYFSLRSVGGPYSSIQGQRKTDVKAGSPPQPPSFQYSFNPKRSDTGAKAGGDAKGGDRRLMQTINYASGTKFGPQLENYFSLRSVGGPYSSIQGQRKTDVKAGSPPQPPSFQYSFNPKRSDTGAKAGGDAKGGDRRLMQTINYASGTKFGPQLENYFSLRSVGGPYSSIQGQRKTDVKAGSPPQPPSFQYSFNPKRSDTGAKAGGDAKGGDRRLMQTINYASGTKFGPQLENYFSLRSVGGPYSSIQGQRKTDVKAGSPPQPPSFQYSFNPKRSDTGAKAGGDAKGGDRRLMQTINYASGTKFGPQLENYFSLRSVGGPYSSIQGQRKTDVKAGSPPQPPSFQYSFNPKRSDTGAKAGGDAKGGDRRH